MINKILVKRIVIATLGFLSIISVGAYLSLKEWKSDKLTIIELERNREFYFQGRIDSIYRLSSINNAVLISLDTIYLKRTVFNKSSRLFHGLYSKEANKIIFYGQFLNEGTLVMPKYVKVSTKTNSIEYDQVLEPFNEIRTAKVYSKYFLEMAEDFGGNDWIKF